VGKHYTQRRGDAKDVGVGGDGVAFKNPNRLHETRMTKPESPNQTRMTTDQMTGVYFPRTIRRKDAHPVDTGGSEAFCFTIRSFVIRV
jgi:hypothetical protein